MIPRQSLTVHYVNRTLPVTIMLGLPMHGYIVVESKPTRVKVSEEIFTLMQLRIPTDKSGQLKLQAKFAKVFYFGPSPMHAPFHVTEKLYKAALEDTACNPLTKKILLMLQGQSFAAVELFFRKYLTVKKELLKEKIDEPAIFYLAQDPYEITDEATRIELLYLLNLNKTMNGENGALLPFNPQRIICQADSKAFEEDKVVSKAYPKIPATLIYELFQQQWLYQRYLEEKAGIGTSVYDEKENEVGLKSKTLSSTTKKILDKIIKFDDNPYFGASNCNKSTASFLQAAEDHAAKETKRSSETITSGTFLSIGSSLRMKFWHPLSHPPLKHIIEKLLSQMEYKIEEDVFQELVNNKELILQTIEELPLNKQQGILERCLDKHTQLGKIFFSARTWSLRNPDPSRGYLKKVADKLAEIKTKQKSDEQWLMIDRLIHVI